jgi:putative transposase
VNDKLTNSLARVANKLESDPEQSLVFERFLPASEVAEICERLGYGFRERVYTPVTTLWMFLGQTLSPDHSCRDAVHRLNAWRVERGQPKVDSNTTAYCEARQRLPENVVAELAKRSGRRCQELFGQDWLWKGRCVKMADGFTLTMPDTPANQQEYPQQRSQKKGCGFPIMRCVMMFCLATGAALDIATAPYRGKQTGENSLLQKIIDLLRPGDILLADRYYATFANIHRAYREGYDLVMRSHHKRKIDFRRGFKQGSYDQIVVYHKPARRPVWMSLQEYRDSDDFVLVRHVSYEVKQKGFRVKRIILATTLLDCDVYPIDDLAKLYVQRWQVELDIRSLKTHMQMEHLRCKSPSMVRKEIGAHLIAYNLIRDLIVQTAIRFGTKPQQLSHKGAVQALNAFADKLQATSDRITALEVALYESIAEHPIGDRAPRIHPREIKRRPKPYPTMKQPRHAAKRSAA